MTRTAQEYADILVAAAKRLRAAGEFAADDFNWGIDHTGVPKRLLEEVARLAAEQGVLLVSVLGHPVRRLIQVAPGDWRRIDGMIVSVDADCL